MKLFKKLAAALVATMLVMTMIGGGALSAFADGNSGTVKKYTVTITPNADDKGNHTYEAYQIFKGELSGSGTQRILSNIQWGEGITQAGQTALAGSGTAAAYAASLKDYNAEQAEALAKQISQYLASPTAEGTTSLELPAGYYLIMDKADSPNGSGSPASKTKFILYVVGKTSVKVKSSVPSVEKKVQDINDTSGTTSLTRLQDSADYDIGDEVPYTVTATIGDGIDNYPAYSFQFVDDMTVGLTLLPASWKIMAGGASGTDISELFTLTSGTGNASGSTLWTWAATNLKGKSGTAITDGMQIVLTYKCELNENAVIGAEGNPNEVKLNFDNNPNASGQGKPSGSTPWDKNIVFTYKTVFNKVERDGSGTKPLAGANFKLEKYIEGSGWVEVTRKETTNSGTSFAFSGLDDGKYKLTETQTPPGYNTIDPIEFTITAEHEIKSDDPKLTSLTGTDGKEFTMTLMSDSGTLSAKVINESGATLPETGGIGTTIFYVLGAILVLGGGVLLVTRRRMAA